MADPIGRAIAAARRNPQLVVIGGAVAGVAALAILRPIQGDSGAAPAENAPATTTPAASIADLFGQRAELYQALQDFAGAGAGGTPDPSPTPPPASSSSAPLPSPSSARDYLASIGQAPRTSSSSSAPLPSPSSARDYLASIGQAPRTLVASHSPLPGGVSQPGAEPRRVAITRAPAWGRYLDGRMVRIPAGRELPVAKGILGGEVTHLVVAGPFAGAHLRRHSSTYEAFGARELVG